MEGNFLIINIENIKIKVKKTIKAHKTKKTSKISKNL